MNLNALLLIPLATGAAPVPTPAPQMGELRRVAEFDAKSFEDRLATKDLDAREKAFADLVEDAVASDAARSAVRAWSTDASRPDLAWTARLALREIERRPGTHLRALKQFGGGAMGDLRQRFDELERQFGGLDSMFGDLQRDLDRLFTAPTPAPGAAPGARSQSRSFRMQSGPDGVEIQVDDDVDGQTKTETYRGRTLEEILAANPHLKDRIGLDADGADPFGPGFRGFSWRTPQAAPPRGFDPDALRWGEPARPLTPRSPSEPNATPGKVRTDVLGVLYTLPSEEQRQRRSIEAGVGLLVEGTQPGTIAAALGVQSGDVLVALNGRTLREREDVVQALSARTSGEAVTLELVDAKGRRHTLTWNES